jgi:Na+-driven multidrug efflux pump
MVLTSVYTMVDALFISHYAGEIALAAVNFVFPVIMLLGGLGFMFGTGGTALVAKTFGQGDSTQARRYFTQITLLAALIGCAMATLGILFLPEVCLLLGGTQDIIPDAVLYGRIMLGFLPCCILQCSFQALLVAAEKPKMAFWLSVAGGVTNIALDLLFVVVFDWGLAGAAWATGLSQAVAGLVPVLYFSRPNDSLLRFVRTGLDVRPMLQACSNGASELVTGVSASFVGMLLVSIVSQFFAGTTVNVFGIQLQNENLAVGTLIILFIIGYVLFCKADRLNKALAK